MIFEISSDDDQHVLDAETRKHNLREHSSGRPSSIFKISSISNTAQLNAGAEIMCSTSGSERQDARIVLKENENIPSEERPLLNDISTFLETMQSKNLALKKLTKKQQKRITQLTMENEKLKSENHTKDAKIRMLHMQLAYTAFEKDMDGYPVCLGLCSEDHISQELLPQTKLENILHQVGPFDRDSGSLRHLVRSAKGPGSSPIPSTATEPEADQYWRTASGICRAAKKMAILSTSDCSEFAWSLARSLVIGMLCSDVFS